MNQVSINIDNIHKIVDVFIERATGLDPSFFREFLISHEFFLTGSALLYLIKRGHELLEGNFSMLEEIDNINLYSWSDTLGIIALKMKTMEIGYSPSRKFYDLQYDCILHDFDTISLDRPGYISMHVTSTRSEVNRRYVRSSFDLSIIANLYDGMTLDVHDLSSIINGVARLSCLYERRHKTEPKLLKRVEKFMKRGFLNGQSISKSPAPNDIYLKTTQERPLIPERDISSLPYGEALELFDRMRTREERKFWRILGLSWFKNYQQFVDMLVTCRHNDGRRVYEKYLGPDKEFSLTFPQFLTFIIRTGTGRGDNGISRSPTFDANPIDIPGMLSKRVEIPSLFEFMDNFLSEYVDNRNCRFGLEHFLIVLTGMKPRSVACSENLDSVFIKCAIHNIMPRDFDNFRFLKDVSPLHLLILVRCHFRLNGMALMKNYDSLMVPGVTVSQIKARFDHHDIGLMLQFVYTNRGSDDKWYDICNDIMVTCLEDMMSALQYCALERYAMSEDILWTLTGDILLMLVPHGPISGIGRFGGCETPRIPVMATPLVTITEPRRTNDDLLVEDERGGFFILPAIIRRPTSAVIPPTNIHDIQWPDDQVFDDQRTDEWQFDECQFDE